MVRGREDLDDPVEVEETIIERENDAGDEDEDGDQDNEDTDTIDGMMMMDEVRDGHHEGVRNAV